MIRTNYEQARNRQIILPHLLHRAVQAEPGHHGGRSFRDHLLVGHRRVPDRQLRGAPHPEPPMADGGDRVTTKRAGTMIPEITPTEPPPPAPRQDYHPCAVLRRGPRLHHVRSHPSPLRLTALRASGRREHQTLAAGCHHAVWGDGVKPNKIIA